MIKRKNQKQLSWDELYEEKKLGNRIQRHYSTREKEKDHENFLLESRLQLMEDSLNKTKIGSEEFNALLDECVDIYLQLNESIDPNQRPTILAKVKDRLIEKEFIGEFDGKPLKQDKKEWPISGRITLRDAIEKRDIGQNPKAKNSKNVDDVFGSNTEIDGQPSPSSCNQCKNPN